MDLLTLSSRTTPRQSVDIEIRYVVPTISMVEKKCDISPTA